MSAREAGARLCLDCRNALWLSSTLALSGERGGPRLAVDVARLVAELHERCARTCACAHVSADIVEK